VYLRIVYHWILSYIEVKNDPGDGQDYFKGCTKLDYVLVPYTYEDEYFCDMKIKKTDTTISGANSVNSHIVHRIIFSMIVLFIALNQW